MAQISMKVVFTETKSMQYTVYPLSNTCTEFSRICFKSDLRQLIRSKRIFACLLGLCINATVLAAFASPISKENVINSSSSIAKQDLRHTHTHTPSFSPQIAHLFHPLKVIGRTKKTARAFSLEIERVWLSVFGLILPLPMAKVNAGMPGVLPPSLVV